jgi:hypothetical protein
MSGFICAFQQILLGCLIQKLMGGTCSTSGSDERSAYSILAGKPNGKRKVWRPEGK